MTPEERAYHFEQTASMPKPQWGTAWTELYGYVSEAAAEGSSDAELIRQYMVELKERYVTGPVKAWIRDRAGA